MAKEARDKVRQLKSILKVQVSKELYKETIVKVSKVRSRVWDKSQQRHNNKVDFLTRKHENCCDCHKDLRKWSKDPRRKSQPRRTSSTTETDIDPLITSTLVLDEELDNLERDKQMYMFNDKEVMIYGDVKLDDNERAVLQRRPEFSLYDKICKDKMDEEMNTTLTKIRWDRRSWGWTMEDQDDDANLSSQEAKDKHDQEEREKLDQAQERLVLDKDNNTIDMGARRATDMRHNQRLVMPQPRPPLEEAVLHTRLEVWKGALHEYMTENCSEDGQQNTHNLTTAERIGLRSLKKRIKGGEIVVLPADKGNRLVVSSLDSYSRQGESARQGCTDKWVQERRRPPRRG